MKSVFITMFVSVIVAACSSGNCRSQPENQKKMSETEMSLPSSQKVLDRVRVFQYDGSLQCGKGKALTVADMQKQLNGIQVFKAEAKTDGLMRMQVCGTATGKANVYEISRTDLGEAKKRGFQEWTFE